MEKSIKKGTDFSVPPVPSEGCVGGESILTNLNTLNTISVDRNQANLVLADLDLELVARLETHLGSVDPTHHQVAIEMDSGAESGLTTSDPDTSGVIEVEALGVQQRLIERGEVQALSPILFDADIASSTDKIRLGGVGHLLDDSQEIGAGQLLGSSDGGSSHWSSGL